jgi:hypothetical protein
MTLSRGADVVECTAHLPGLLVPGGGPIALGDGELTELTFDEWSALETEFDYAARHFERSRPAFFRQSMPMGPTEGDDPLGRVAAAFGRVRTLVHRALLLATTWPLPEPALSSTYFSHGPVARLQIGPYGREHILYAREGRVELDADDLERLRVAHALLSAEAALPRDGALEAAFGALERTTRPEFTRFNRFMHEMIVLEQLLLPEQRKQLAETFARRAAVLLVSEPAQLPEAEDVGRRLYTTRSQLVHGKDVETALEGGPFDLDQLLRIGRWVLCEVLGRVAAWRATAPEGDSLELAVLRAEIDDARREPDTWQTLSRRWELAA